MSRRTSPLIKPRRTTRSERIRLLVASLAAALRCCLPSVAGAEEAPQTRCHGVSARTPGSIIVPIDDAPEDGEPRHGAIIDLGETLCVAGTVASDGHVRDLHLADESSGEPVLLVLAFHSVGTSHVLEVQSRSSRPIRYEAAFLHGPAGIAIPTSVPDVAPGGHAYASWPTRENRLLVFGFHAVEAAPPEAPQRGQALGPPEERSGFALRIGWGMRSASLGGLAQVLEERGYSGVPGLVHVVDLGLTVVLRRVRFDLSVAGGGKRSTSSAGDAEIGTWISDVSVAAGYDFFRAGGLSAFGMAGVGISAVRADATALRVGQRDDDRVAQQFGVGTLEAGIEQIIPLVHRATDTQATFVPWTFVLDLRGGLVAPFVDGTWHLDDKRGTEVPGPDTSPMGGRVLLTLGIGMYSQ